MGTTKAKSENKIRKEAAMNCSIAMGNLYQTYKQENDENGMARLKAIWSINSEIEQAAGNLERGLQTILRRAGEALDDLWAGRVSNSSCLSGIQEEVEKDKATLCSLLKQRKVLENTFKNMK